MRAGERASGPNRRTEDGAAPRFSRGDALCTGHGRGAHVARSARRGSLSRVAAGLALLLAGTAPAALPRRARAQVEAVEEAARHFDLGTGLFNQRRYDAALAEFRHAYDLAPAAPVLYNLGRVHAALGHAVEAVDSFERYLREEPDVRPERRREVEAALDTQRALIGTLTVVTNVPGSVISVGGIDLATTPMQRPIRVAAGRVTVGAHAPGHEAIRRSVEIAGGVDRTLQIELRREAAARGTLRVTSPIPGVRVLVDGRPVGLTPLDRTLPVPSGSHVVQGERPGYLTARADLVVEEGAEVELRLDLGRDPATGRGNLGRLHLHMPEASSTVRLDGVSVDARGGSVQLVAGPHRLDLVCVEREPYRTRIDVPAGGTLDLTPALEWTPEARASLLEDAADRRALGWWLGVPGAVLLAAGAPLFIWNEGRISATDQQVLRLNQQIEACGGAAACEDDARAGYGDLGGDQSREDVLRVVSLASAGAGLVLFATGVVLVIGAPGEQDVDSAAHAEAGPSLRLGVGASSVVLSGTF